MLWEMTPKKARCMCGFIVSVWIFCANFLQANFRLDEVTLQLQEKFRAQTDSSMGWFQLCANFRNITVFTELNSLLSALQKEHAELLNKYDSLERLLKTKECALNELSERDSEIARLRTLYAQANVLTFCSSFGSLILLQSGLENMRNQLLITASELQAQTVKAQNLQSQIDEVQKVISN